MRVYCEFKGDEPSLREIPGAFRATAAGSATPPSAVHAFHPRRTKGPITMTTSGTWELTIDSPLGKQHAVVNLIQNSDGSWQGMARDLGSGEETQMTDISIQGDKVGWRQHITKPMKLKLTYDLTLDNDRLTGKVKAGLFPASKVVGERVPAEAASS